MPLYKYKCNCGNIFEQLSTIEERNNVDCPQCGARPTIVITPPVAYNPRLFHKFFKEGEGFTTVQYSKEEARERIRANASKYD